MLCVHFADMIIIKKIFFFYQRKNRCGHKQNSVPLIRHFKMLTTLHDLIFIAVKFCRQFQFRFSCCETFSLQIFTSQINVNLFNFEFNFDRLFEYLFLSFICCCFTDVSTLLEIIRNILFIFHQISVRCLSYRSDVKPSSSLVVFSSRHYRLHNYSFPLNIIKCVHLCVN